MIHTAQEMGGVIKHTVKTVTRFLYSCSFRSCHFSTNPNYILIWDDAFSLHFYVVRLSLFAVIMTFLKKLNTYTF